MSTLSFIVLLFAIFHSVFSFPNQDCPAISCGRLGNLNFPFTNPTSPDFCGPFVVHGCDREIQTIQLGRKWYQTQNISRNDSIYGFSISVTDTELQEDLNSRKCESFDWTPPDLPFASFQILSDVKALYKCEKSVPFLNYSLSYSIYEECSKFNIFYLKKVIVSFLPSDLPTHPNCSIQRLPLNTETTDDRNIFTMLAANFSLQVTVNRDCYGCVLERQNCLFNDNGEFNGCGFPGPHYESTQPESEKKRHKGLGIKLGVGIGSITVLIILMLGIFFLSNTSIFCWKINKQEHQSIEAFLSQHGSMAPKRYKYIEIKKITGSFKDKLGQGGYGTVFKGKLTDGTLVAVKVLKESKSNGEEFINEVASIIRTSHVNIVTLLGFCFEGSKRALVYEFVSNGSLDKYIENHPNADRQLGWETLQRIAVGIARGLEYLHRGCKTRILHFDIKPHNILLDVDLCPKISDFGLAKICLTKESIVSMLGARGTAGYIAPEVFCRNFGGVSHKSDVYSYGMLLFEMIGGRRNPCVLADNSSDIYFPHWIFKRLELGQELGLPGIGKEEDNQIARKMMLVSLWCIQSDPSKRPPMSRVIEMLQSNAESLSIPPKPYLSSPSRSPPRSGASSSTVVSLNCS